VQYIGAPPPSAVNMVSAEIRSHGEKEGDSGRKLLLARLDAARMHLMLAQDKATLYNAAVDAAMEQVNMLEALL
jgi:hypothetical protein